MGIGRDSAWPHGHNRVCSQRCVGTIVCEHRLVRTSMHGHNHKYSALILHNDFFIDIFCIFHDLSTRSHSVVVITSALHAEGPRFEPWWEHFIFVRAAAYP